MDCGSRILTLRVCWRVGRRVCWRVSRRVSRRMSWRMLLILVIILGRSETILLVLRRMLRILVIVLNWRRLDKTIVTLMLLRVLRRVLRMLRRVLRRMRRRVRWGVWSRMTVIVVVLI